MIGKTKQLHSHDLLTASNVEKYTKKNDIFCVSRATARQMRGWRRESF